MKKLVLLSVLTAVGLAAGAAYAVGQPGPNAGHGGRHWDKLDADGDGEISLSEMTEPQRAMIAAADADGSGGVSKAEMQAHHQKKRAAMRSKRLGDQNGDGVVDRSEYDAASAARFAALDANGDGVIGEDEMPAGRRGHHGKRRGK